MVVNDSVSNRVEEKVIKLESEVEHIKEDVSDIKHSVSEINKSNSNIEKALVKLSMIADQNQKLEPRVTAIERLTWRAIGGGSALITAIGLVAMYFKTFR